jgi:ubiquinone/menaquinone biosynthesis C-methylase UbiE
MRPRVTLAHFLLRLGRFIQSLAIMVMRPDDLVEFSRQSYGTPRELNHWGNDETVGQGLSPLETALLDQVPIRKGRLLLLDVGGGREAIPLAKLGFEVTGVDFVPAMVQKAQENAIRHGVEITGCVQEISELHVPSASYDMVWLSNSMYSCLPTRKRRVEMLRRVRMALKSGGFFICMFHWGKTFRFSAKVELVRKVFAYVSLGNLWYEPEDFLWQNVEFLHAFSSEQEIRSEFAEGGFAISYLHIPESGMEGGAMLCAD